MATANPNPNPAGSSGHRAGVDPADHRTRRLATETKSALKTTEFFVYIACVIAVLIASMVVGTEDNHLDYFRADRCWLYIVVLTVGYMLSRGLAKSGSRDHHDS